VEYPIITGHEIVGTVRLKGSNVTEFQIGDRVGVGAQCYACLNREGKSCPGCSSGNENHCEIDHVDTYNGIFKDGQRTQGGYADAYRCDKHFVFNIPDNISSHEAAPLLCAGCTTYSPLVRHGCGPNKRVGIIGLGGLGHLAVQFASKLGAKEVVVFSHSKSKSEIAKQLGATACVSFEDEEESKKYKSALDIVLVCGNAKDMPWERYLDVVAFNGIFL
jgi:D-arabinose 1-dehydrogenase-like Zn-dependent alcohol dehydrogenase